METQHEGLLKYAFDNLHCYLSTEDAKDFPDELEDGSYPIFVTWKKNGALRGCIGTFASAPLSKNLPRYSLVAAVQDSRFPPIAEKELPDLTCCISLLSHFEDIEHPLEWEVGKHGIEVEFVVKGEPYRATFLPEVASERDWDQTTTLRHLVRKAGFMGKFEETLGSYKMIRRYQSIKMKMEYSEWKALSSVI